MNASDLHNKGFRPQSDGGYAKPKTAKQHNTEAGVGEVILDAGESAKSTTDNRREQETPPDTADIARVEFLPQMTTDEYKLNKTEARWLDVLRFRDYQCLRIQSFTLKLAADLRFTPDFSAIVDGRMTFWEVKGGFIREDGWIKLKTAARLYPEFTFVMAQYKGGAWDLKTIKP